VTNGGPQAFLLQNLLRFPQAMSPSAVLIGIHAAAATSEHTCNLTSSGENARSRRAARFRDTIANSQLTERDFDYLLERAATAAALLAEATTASWLTKCRVFVSPPGCKSG